MKGFFFDIMESILSGLSEVSEKKFYVEVEDKSYLNHSIENNILRERKKPESLKEEYEIANESKIRKIHRVLEKENEKLEVKSYPK